MQGLCAHDISHGSWVVCSRVLKQGVAEQPDFTDCIALHHQSSSPEAHWLAGLLADILGLALMLLDCSPALLGQVGWVRGTYVGAAQASRRVPACILVLRRPSAGCLGPYAPVDGLG